MAAQNLFEKYGIKEVADVTFYRIEKKEETYESQRDIKISSVLKGAVEIRTVYPIEDGVGSTEGFEAYVFTDADLILGTNYDCDDIITLTITVKGTYSSDTRVTTTTVTDFSYDTLEESGYEFSAGYPKVLNNSTRTYTSIEELERNGYVEDTTTSTGSITYSNEKVIHDEEADTDTYEYDFIATFPAIKYELTADLSTGVYNNNADVPDATREVGTHEYSYVEQAFMLFAKRQNLITKTGTRYHFEDVDNLVGNLMFQDGYAPAPKSNERVVVLGVATGDGIHDTSWSDTSYDFSEIEKELSSLGSSFEAKAYDVVYSLYAELTVEDEMGYYNPNFLGSSYNKNTQSITGFTLANSYATWSAARKGTDSMIANATMWGNNEHFSINDAIDALRQQRKILDVGESGSIVGVNSLFGGYKVSNRDTVNTAIPDLGKEDSDATYNANYTYNSQNSTLNVNSTKYPLSAVLDALNELANIEEVIGKDIRVGYTPEGKTSNRAIYVAGGTTAASARSYMYLLHNKNYRKLASDTEGVFTFEDKKGNKLYYQDKIFKTVEWLALVIIGNKGMIFIVNRHGNTDVTRIAWMMNDNGYLTDTKAKKVVSNGLIHTTDITVGNETFEATCAVKSLSIHKVNKKTLHYVPVLFLDTLKISTLEQTAEETYATGGKGNANLIGWDFGKEITLTLQDALYTPASMSAIFGSYEGNDFRKGVKEAKSIDRTEKVIAKRSFIVPEGNLNGTPTEADKTAQAVFIDPNTMDPYPDGTPIAEGEVFYKYTRSIAYEGQSIGKVIEISADKFPGTYKVVGDTFARSKETGEDERFQFVIPQAKMTSEQTITLEADGEPVVNNSNATVKVA